MMGIGDSPAALRASSLSTACRTVTPWATTSRKMRRLAWQYATDDGLVTPASTAASTASSCTTAQLGKLLHTGCKGGLVRNGRCNR